MSKALLLSGGIDSTALAAWQRPDFAILIDYGQLPAQGELRASRIITKELNIPLHFIRIDCSSIGSGMLSGNEKLSFSPSIEWWPYRNQLLISLAGSKAISEGAEELLIGTVKTDGFHVDGTKPFVDSISSLMSMQEGALKVNAPAIEMTSGELVRMANVNLELLGWTHSCHQAEWACGICPGCMKHLSVIKEFNV